jgi:hypothetical protein
MHSTGSSSRRLLGGWVLQVLVRVVVVPVVA